MGRRPLKANMVIVKKEVPDSSPEVVTNVPTPRRYPERKRTKTIRLIESVRQATPRPKRKVKYEVEPGDTDSTPKKRRVDADSRSDEWDDLQDMKTGPTNPSSVTPIAAQCALLPEADNACLTLKIRLPPTYQEKSQNVDVIKHEQNETKKEGRHLRENATKASKNGKKDGILDAVQFLVKQAGILGDASEFESNAETVGSSPEEVDSVVETSQDDKFEAPKHSGQNDEELKGLTANMGAVVLATDDERTIVGMQNPFDLTYEQLRDYFHNSNANAMYDHSELPNPGLIEYAEFMKLVEINDHAELMKLSSSDVKDESLLPINDVFPIGDYGVGASVDADGFGSTFKLPACKLLKSDLADNEEFGGEDSFSNGEIKPDIMDKQDCLEVPELDSTGVKSIDVLVTLTDGRVLRMPIPLHVSSEKHIATIWESLLAFIQGTQGMIGAPKQDDVQCAFHQSDVPVVIDQVGQTLQ